MKLFLHLTLCISWSAEAVKYTDRTSADPPRNECPGYETKQSDG